MKIYSIKELMVPLSEYATVSEGTTLFDAVTALEKAQEEFDHTKYRHRAILILNKKNRVIGKLTQSDVLRALEPEDASIERIKELSQFGFTAKFVRDLQKEKRLSGAPLKELYKKAGRVKVEDFMQSLTEGEYVEQETSLDIAIHQLVLGNHSSLLVTHKKEIVGILRLTDVFAAVFHAMKQAGIKG